MKIFHNGILVTMMHLFMLIEGVLMSIWYKLLKVLMWDFFKNPNITKQIIELRPKSVGF